MLTNKTLLFNNKLHPAFGLDEDWNLPSTNHLEPLALILHPAFGLDEDWNLALAAAATSDPLLHPAFGLDEDWNSTTRLLLTK